LTNLPTITSQIHADLEAKEKVYVYWFAILPRSLISAVNRGGADLPP